MAEREKTVKSIKQVRALVRGLKAAPVHGIKIFEKRHFALVQNNDVKNNSGTQHRQSGYLKFVPAVKSVAFGREKRRVSVRAFSEQAVEKPGKQNCRN